MNSVEELEIYFQKTGLEVYRGNRGSRDNSIFVYLYDLLPLFKDAKVVYTDDNKLWEGIKSYSHSAKDVATALLINIQPIKPKTTEQEAIDLLKRLSEKQSVGENVMQEVRDFLSKVEGK